MVFVSPFANDPISAKGGGVCECWWEGKRWWEEMDGRSCGRFDLTVLGGGGEGGGGMDMYWHDWGRGGNSSSSSSSSSSSPSSSLLSQQVMAQSVD